MFPMLFDSNSLSGKFFPRRAELYEARNFFLLPKPIRSRMDSGGTMCFAGSGLVFRTVRSERTVAITIFQSRSVMTA